MGGEKGGLDDRTLRGMKVERGDWRGGGGGDLIDAGGEIEVLSEKERGIKGGIERAKGSARGREKDREREQGLRGESIQLCRKVKVKVEKGPPFFCSLADMWNWGIS